MKRIAVIGAGISGMAAAYYLSRRHETYLFEKDTRLGGHTNTLTVDSSRGPLPVDTGFIVHNTRNYPNLVRLLQELGVPTEPSDMSFSVHDVHTGFEYSTRGLRGFFAQSGNALRPGHYRLLGEIHRFNSAARKLLETPGTEEICLSDFLESRRFGAEFTRRYLFPLASSIWSASMAQIGSFPALTLLRFFENHGMLRLTQHITWRTIPGGSQTYIAPLTAPYRERIVTGAKLLGVARHEAGVRLRFADRPPQDFDEVVLACHGPQALALLEAPSEGERDVLRHFHTVRNEAVLHTDSNLLPKTKGARASWNYHLDGDDARGATLTYHMNRLQSLPVREDYCVSLNANGSVDRSKIVRRMDYFHPLYTLESVRAQERWAEISGRDRTHFCGAYWRFGFHEDGLTSAMRVARALGVEC